VLNWQVDLLNLTQRAVCEQDVLAGLQDCTRALGFEHCAYGLRRPLPFTNQKTILLNTYPLAWRERYVKAGYIHIDPTVQHGRRTQTPVTWSDELFSLAPDLWAEAKSFGLRIGWAQSSLDCMGVVGMLTLSRSCEQLGPGELQAKERQMGWLVHAAHLSMTKILNRKRLETSSYGLTGREIEVLKWTADGKSSQDIADILLVSKNTIEFHVKNAVNKLQSANKTAAVVRAAVLGLLN
jgi:DNA-binding CsgD family transcriptional regulator